MLSNYKLQQQLAEGEKIREIIRAEVTLLRQSETGRRVQEQLYAFLEGRCSNLDGRGWEAVLRLIIYYQNGYAGSVLDTLAEGAMTR